MKAAIAAAEHPTPLVSVSKTRCLGRQSELGRLLDCFTLAQNGSSALVLISGPSGVGKSTLLMEAQRKLRDAGALLLETRCRPGLPSLRPLRDLVREAAAELSREGESPSLCDAAADLLETLDGRASSAAPGDRLALRIELFERISELFTEISLVRPTALVLHDLDLADASTLEGVRYLARVLASPPELSRSRFRGLILASTGDVETVFSEREWLGGMNLLHLELAGLDAAGVRAFLSSDEVVSSFLSASAGVPSRLQAMVSRPANVESEAARHQNLGSSEKCLLETLAVFGRPMGPETLRLLTDLPHERLARTIAVLVELQLIEKTVLEGELRVSFCRAGDQRAVYQTLSAEVRRERHARIGTFLETQGERELEACADHLLRAGCGDRAVRLGLAAAQRLEVAFCFERAVDLCERALAQTEHGGQKSEIEEKLADLYELTGKLDQALVHVQSLRRRRPDDTRWSLRVAQLQFMRGDLTACRTELRELRQSIERETPPRSVAAQILSLTANVQLQSGDTDGALAAASEGLLLCGADEELRRVRLSLQETLAKIHLEQEDVDAAHRLLQSYLQTARDAALPAEEIRALAQLGALSLHVADYPSAEHYYQEARQLAEAVGDARLTAACSQHTGVMAERRGDFGAALILYQAAVAGWKKVGHRSYLSWVGLDLGNLYLSLGDVERGKAMLSLAERLLEAEPLAALRINVALLQGRIAEHERKLQEAAERFARALDLADGTGHLERRARAQLALAGVALDRGDAAGARQLLQCELGRVPAHLQLRALLLSGRAELALSDLGAAAGHLCQALELCSSVQDAESSWQVRLELARLARSEGRLAEARRLLAEAASGEERVRSTVPEEFWPLMADLPSRVALRRAREESGLSRDAGSLAEAPRHLPERPEPAAQQAISPKASRWQGMVGGNRRMLQLYAQIERVAAHDATVLIRGESGTGKELIAEAIHRQSQRAGNPLVKVNCGALVESLLLSELFGHERGAFTGAMQRRKGRFEAAEGGTIFLDEIGDISPKTQVALLRVLQEKTFERVGGNAPLRANVRIICATNRDLEAMVARGEFREDLYYRLAGVRLEVPPLRERQDDIPLITQHLLERIGRERQTSPKQLSAEAAALLQSYPWPGNVRELENVLRSVSLFSDGERLTAPDFADYPELCASKPQLLPTQAVTAPATLGPYEQVRSLGWSLKDYKKHIEVECITRALHEANGNITHAAELLGMKRPRLSQLIKEHGLQVA